MIARAGEIIKQGIERLVCPATANNRYVVGNRNGTAIFSDTRARAIGRAGGIIYPATTVCIQLGSRTGICTCIRRIRGRNTVDLEYRVGKIDETLDLLITVGGR